MDPGCFVFTSRTVGASAQIADGILTILVASVTTKLLNPTDQLGTQGG